MPPMSSPRARSRNSARAVRKMIGMWSVRASASRSSATRQPSSAGIITSSRITSGRSLRAISSPLGPSLASSTVMSSASRLTRQSSRIGGSSSMTRTRVFTSESTCALTSALDTRALPSDARRRERQLEPEPRALALLGLDRDPAAHRRHQPLGDEKPETRAGRRLARAVELAEDPLVLRARDADALVGDRKLDGRGTAPPGHDRDRSAVGRELHGVVEQRRENLPQLV